MWREGGWLGEREREEGRDGGSVGVECVCVLYSIIY